MSLIPVILSELGIDAEIGEKAVMEGSGFEAGYPEYLRNNQEVDECGPFGVETSRCNRPL
jgi:hypothetical protein